MIYTPPPFPTQNTIQCSGFGFLNREYLCMRPILVNSRRLPGRCSDTDHCPFGLFCPYAVRAHTHTQQDARLSPLQT